jgi:hypothetical protein
MKKTPQPPAHYELAEGKEKALKVLRDLKQKFERREITCATLRIYKPDGTWEDRVIGGDQDERDAVLAILQRVGQTAN